jgi:hypothetical protein
MVLCCRIDIFWFGSAMLPKISISTVPASDSSDNPETQISVQVALDKLNEVHKIFQPRSSFEDREIEEKLKELLGTIENERGVLQGSLDGKDGRQNKNLVERALSNLVSECGNIIEENNDERQRIRSKNLTDSCQDNSITSQYVSPTDINSIIVALDNFVSSESKDKAFHLSSFSQSNVVDIPHTPEIYLLPAGFENINKDQLLKQDEQHLCVPSRNKGHMDKYTKCALKECILGEVNPSSPRESLGETPEQFFSDSEKLTTEEFAHQIEKITSQPRVSEDSDDDKFFA